MTIEKADIKTKNITHAALIVIMITMIARVLGLLRESALAAYFGASYKTDAYKIAFYIPSILLALIYSSISTTLIPVYTDYLKNKSDKQGRYFINNLFNVLTVISIVITVIGMLLTPLLVKIVAPGFKGEAYDLTVKLTLMVFPTLVFIALANLANGFLQAHNDFTTPAIMGLPYNLILIGSTVFFYRYGIEAVMIGTMFALASQLFVQIPSMARHGYRIMPVFDLKEEGLKRISHLLLPVMASSAFNQIYIIIDRMLASGLDEGSISSMDYANRVNALVFGIFITSIATVMYPRMSYLADQAVEFKKTVAKGLKTIWLITIPTSVGLFILSKPIVQVLFERGAFTEHDTVVTAIALSCFSVGIIGVGMREILNRAFYSLQDTKSPTVNGIIAIGINIVLNLIFVRFWGVGGLAFATSIAAIASSLMLLIRLRRRVGILIDTKIMATLFKSAAASVVMGIVIYLLNRALWANIDVHTSLAVKAVKLFIITGCGGVLYLLVLGILKEQEFFRVLRLLQKSINKKLQ